MSIWTRTRGVPSWDCSKSSTLSHRRHEFWQQTHFEAPTTSNDSVSYISSLAQRNQQFPFTHNASVVQIVSITIYYYLTIQCSALKQGTQCRIIAFEQNVLKFVWTWARLYIQSRFRPACDQNDVVGNSLPRAGRKRDNFPDTSHTQASLFLQTKLCEFIP